MAQHKFETGQRVIYDGLIAVIESKGNYTDGGNCYGLVAEENSELTCTADEGKCELYTDQEIDQSDAIALANELSSAVRRMVDSVTDKYSIK